MKYVILAKSKNTDNNTGYFLGMNQDSFPFRPEYHPSRARIFRDLEAAQTVLFDLEKRDGKNYNFEIHEV